MSWSSPGWVGPIRSLFPNQTTEEAEACVADLRLLECVQQAHVQRLLGRVEHFAPAQQYTAEQPAPTSTVLVLIP